MTYRMRTAWNTVLGTLCAVVSGCIFPDPPDLSDTDYTYSANSAATCHVKRLECLARSTTGCTAWVEGDPPTEFDGIACTVRGETNLDTTCWRTFCSKTDGIYYRPGQQYCSAKAITVTAYAPSTPGICRPDTVSAHQARITYQQRYRLCTAGADGTACATIGESSPSDTVTECVDVSENGAIPGLLPSSTVPAGIDAKQIVNGSVKITAFEPDFSDCPLTGPASAAQQLNYVSTAGEIGSVLGAGVSVPLTATQGTASLQTHAGGYYYTVDQFKVSLADVSVLGTSLTGLVVRSVGPVIVGWDGRIATGGVKLLATGRMNGARIAFPMVNSTPWTANVGPTQLELNGSVKVLAEDAQRKSLPVTATFDATMPVASPAQVACAAASPRQRLFGFEERAMFWSGNAVLSQVTAPTTQGCGALGISGQGYMIITTNGFSTVGLNLQPALSVDLYVPDSQPNPYWTGALQMYLSCASGNVYNQYIGQVELTNLTQNQFSALRFPLSAQTTSTLQRNLTDCNFSYALNVNQTTRIWKLDNLRFTP